MNPVFIRVFPELNRFPDPDAAKKACRRATWRLLLSRQWWLANMAVVFLFISAITLVPRLLSPYVNRNTIMLWLPLAGGAVFPFFVALVVFFLRRSIQRSLRKQLVEGGIPCCIQCGYDLTGNASGICPECGEEK